MFQNEKKLNIFHLYGVLVNRIYFALKSITSQNNSFVELINHLLQFNKKKKNNRNKRYTNYLIGKYISKN